MNHYLLTQRQNIFENSDFLGNFWENTRAIPTQVSGKIGAGDVIPREKKLSEQSSIGTKVTTIVSHFFSFRFIFPRSSVFILQCADAHFTHLNITESIPR